MPIEKANKHPDRWARFEWKQPGGGGGPRGLDDEPAALNLGKPPRCRASGQFERYFPTDPRVAVGACAHTQILDIDFPAGIVRCLDCGYALQVKRDWLPVLPHDILSDAQLLTARIVFNDVHFDKTYKFTAQHDDDPEKELQVRRDLAARGIERITPDNVRKLTGTTD